MINDFQTTLLQEKIELMKQYHAEKDFKRIQGLFIKGVDTAIITQTFRETYAPEFQFQGTPQELFETMQDWLKKNY